MVAAEGEKYSLDQEGYLATDTGFPLIKKAR
jgi:hypothetical protein